MDDIDLELLLNHPEWLSLLEAYLSRQESLRREIPEQSGGPRYIPRITELEGVESSSLAEIHGQLIALGFLQFQFEDGSHGLTYRVSTLGRNLATRVRFKSEESVAESAA
ncbi:MAG: hypothetical protein KDA80_23270 [Planctomycetaceae bacterium]|nr:hypothetical protein [Planctomycetaceae bacterium]